MKGAGMWGSVRVLVVCCAAVAAGLLMFVSGGSPSLNAGLVTSSFELDGPLLGGGIQTQAGIEHSLGDEAELLESRTKFEHLGVGRADGVDRETFPGIVDRSGGPPPMPAGGRIVHFVSDHAAQVVLRGGKRAVVESMAPMAVETSRGHRAPVDLGLRRVGSDFESVRPMVGVLIPQRLGDGVQLPEGNVSLTPVDEHGVALTGSAKMVSDASVLYANTQPDTDTVVKPTTEGFETDTVLRSIDSPERLYFSVGLSKGASLVQNQGDTGPVEVVEQGRTIALIRPPAAIDAAGSPVPVSMTATGDTLALMVSTHAGEYRWPIEVDPELWTVPDRTIGGSECLKPGETERISSNWCIQAHQESKFGHHWSSSAVEQYNVGSITAGEYTDVQYHTAGESKIYKVEVETAGNVPKGRAKVQLTHGVKKEGKEEGEVEKSVTLAEHSGYGATKTTLCANAECSTAGGNAGNLAWYRLEAIEPAGEAYGISGTLENTTVWIAQEKAPEVTFNETEPTIDGGRANTLYGSEHGTGEPQAWLSPSSGAFEVKAHDPGIGVSWAQIAIGGWRQEEPIYKEGKCLGVQCNEDYHTSVTYNPAMPDGEQSIEWDAKNLAGSGELGLLGLGLLNKEYQLVKVDGTPPYNIEVSGWPINREISATPHALTFEATDGTGPTHSSGMGSISVSVDGGQESQVPIVACHLGPCTSNGKWTLPAEGLTEGVHRLIVTATDNAGNAAAEEFTFDVRHGNPVPVGPGSVDPTSGQLKLSATDASLAGSGAVSRVYESRNLTAGNGGPLGPQWALGLSGGQGITVLPTGSVVLAGSAGGVTTFLRNNKGEFESPLGDGNVKIEAKEKETGKGITEYLLKDAAVGTTTTFEQPVGTDLTVPLYSSQFGNGGVQLNKPASVAVDASGDVWVADYNNNRIVKFSPAGTLLAAYGSYGSWLGNLINPRGIAINQSNGNVYVSDEGNNRIVEYNSSGTAIAAFGWGVNDGKSEFEICTSYCRAGISGSGEGQLHEPKGLAVDGSGNIWVSDYANNRIQEFKAEGKYQKSIGKTGSGEGQFNGPVGIALSGGNLYVAEAINDRVQEVSTTGEYIAQIGTMGKEGSGNYEFKTPRGIAIDPRTGSLYVADSGNNRVQEFNSSNKFIATIGSAGSGAGQFSDPRGVAISTSGGIYVTDFNNNRVQEWTRPLWLPTRSEGPLPSATISYAYTSIEVEEGKTVIEPLEALAPAPVGVSCGAKPEELKKGCRALTFEYAKETGATGEGPSEWGSYKGHLNRIEFHAWDRAKGAMTKEQFVAQYAYDTKGRLRAEWDPRISPALKTVYGYDEEGHVTTVSQPGQEPWLLHYGGLGTDPSMGRLLSVTHPAASSVEVLKEQSKMAAPVNTEKPGLSSTSPKIGVTLSASSAGKWSNSPLAYSYQWEDCHQVTEPEATVCAPIQGAVNQTYTPQASDAGFKLVVQVTAENFNGAKAVTSAETSAVPMPTPVFSKIYGKAGSENDQFKEPAGISVDSEGNIWIADLANNRVQKLSSSGGFIGAYSPDSMLEPEGIAFNPTNNDVYVTSRGRNRIDVLSSTGTLINVFGGEGSGAGQLKSPDQLAIDSHGNVWVDDTANNRIEEFSSSGSYISSFGSEGSGHGQFKSPVGIAVCNGTIYVTDQGNDRIQEFSLEGKWLGQFGHEGHGNGEFYFPSQIACEPIGNDLYISDKSNNRIEEFNSAGVFLDAFSGSGETQLLTPLGVAVAANGVVYPGDYGNGRIEKWTPEYSTSNPVPAPPSVGTTSVSTIEYQVPLSGVTGLQNLSKGEVAKWGQKDDPTEGMAIFPPDEPMGWPAKEYKRASIIYLDERGRTVNTASPSGAISTTEYNETNDMVRALTADNRATALKETSESAQIAKSEALDSKNTYNLEGTELLETLGPEHKVKLASGSEVQAREHVKYSYDEGAPEGKEHDGLVTKTTDAALVSGKEEDLRTTITSYSGQKGLGWTLRKPTSVTTDPTGLDLTNTTEYDETTGNVIETKAPGGTSETVPPPVFSVSFGSEGSGSGQFKRPVGVATDASGHVWVNDRENGRIEKFSASGSFEGAYGSKGSGAGQLEGAWDLAVNQNTGNVYIGDSWNDRIDEFSSAGVFVETIGWGVSDGKEELEVCKASCKTGLSGTGHGELNYPLGMAVDSHGNILVVDHKNNRVVEYSEAGAYVTSFGSLGSGNGQLNEPYGIAVDEGEIFVTDQGNHRVEEFSPAGNYLNQFGSEGTAPGQFREPAGIAVNPNNGDLYIADESYNRVEEFSPAGKFLVEFGSYGTGPGHFENPTALAINASGDLYVGEDTGERVDEWVPPGAGGAHMVYSTQFGSAGSGSEQFNEPVMSAIDGEGDVWVTDFNHARVKKFTAQGKFLASYGSYGHGEGQFEAPTGIAINQGTGNVYVADCESNRIEELSSTGTYVRAFGGYGGEQGKLDCPIGVKIDSSGDVWVADTHNNRIEEYTSTGAFMQIIGWGVSDAKSELEICKTSCKTGIAGSGNGQFNHPSDIAISGSNLYVADSGNRRVQELTTTGGYATQFGNQGDAGAQFVYPEAIATDSAGHLYVVDFGNDRIEEFSATGEFLTYFGSHGPNDGQLNGPRGIAINAAGDAYVADTENNRIEIWAPNNQAVHDTQTIYYSTAANPTYPACGEHPEWAALVCQTQPAGQPEGGINLPVSTFTYNLWDEIETTTETFGTTKRTKAQTYDPAGRALTSKTSSTINTALPEVVNEYNTETGALENQSTIKTGEETRTITSKQNTLGQITSYTDADKNTTTYEYEPNADDRLTGVNDGKGTQTYAYDPTSGFLNKLVDSAAGTFTASYDVEGKMLTETYPDGLTATSTANSLGQATGLAYEKKAHCATTCPETWFSDTVVPSIHGETLSQTSTLAKESYGYDNSGRLTQTQEEPTGEGCTTRIYAYDEESNRTSLITRKPGGEGKCATEGGTPERHIYDTANRLTDSGVAYETFGNTTTLPAADAGGKYEITSSYYVDNQIASQTQNEKTLNYHYDPAGRTRETETILKGKTEPTMITHYPGSGEAVTWTSEGSEKWSRNIPGIDGALDAIQTSTGTTTLQLHDLQGNIIATASTSETETKLLSSYNSTEFGVPNESKTLPKYAWLGATGISTELASGVATKGGASYVPQIARNLQTEPIVPPGAFPNGQGTGTQNTAEIPGWSTALANEESATTLAEYVALQEAAKKAAIKYVFGADPPPYVVHLSVDQVNGILNELRTDSKGSLEETEAGISAIGHFYFATNHEYFVGRVIDAIVAEEQFGFTLIIWGNYLYSMLEECREGLYENGAEKTGTCRVETPIIDYEAAAEGYYQKTEIPNYYFLPNYSICLSGGKQCTRLE